MKKEKKLKGTSGSYISGYSHMVNSCIESENKSHEVIMDSYKLKLSNLKKMQEDPDLTFDQGKEVDDRYDYTIECIREEKSNHSNILERFLEKAKELLVLVIAFFLIKHGLSTVNNETK